MKLRSNSKLKELNSLAIPLIIQSISGLFIGLADQAMIGRISIFAYSAVGVISSLLSLLAGIIGFTSVYFNISGAKSIGKDDEENFNNEFASCLILNIILGLGFFILILLFKKQILTIIYGFEGKILTESIKYLNITSIYLLLQLMLFTFSSFFKIKKATKWILIGSVSSSILNLVLNYILIYGKLGFPQLGIQGAALATILSLLANLVFYIWLCRKSIYLSFSNMGIYKKIMLNNIKSSIPLMGQELLEGSVFVIAVNAIISRIGTVELSTYLILCQLINILLMPMYMYGSSTLTLISQSDGAQNQDDLVTIPKLSIFISMIIYLCLSLLFLLFKDYVPKLITEDSNVISLASNLLLLMIISNIFHPFCTVYKYSLQSINESKFVLFSTSKVNLCILVFMILLVNFLPIKIYGIFIALFLNYFIIFIIYLIKYDKCIHKKFTVLEME